MPRRCAIAYRRNCLHPLISLSLSLSLSPSLFLLLLLLLLLHLLPPPRPHFSPAPRAVSVNKREKIGSERAQLRHALRRGCFVELSATSRCYLVKLLIRFGTPPPALPPPATSLSPSSSCPFYWTPQNGARGCSRPRELKIAVFNRHANNSI